ncbi:TadE/TadG family type IV pilus assembly protein [Rhizobium sp. L1K21]|uniref:TadE/TadG family type IV pilus assembly protein n=1 Tax=Rhizobium sp. L1K21 TaxID=2954933 RepID=UPI0020926FBD|nr:TadE/TadG family type IV pilus assembly protein [Rhizobium sp. L1K21]MCO6186511.1 pilus assembly protein [Rhizobium sp. L1K21]
MRGRTLKQALFSRLKQQTKRLRKDQRGVSAIEFALIFPILIVLFAGAVDLGQALMVHRKINQIVGTTTDIVSRDPSWTASKLDAVLKGASSIILPFKTSDLKLTVMVVDINSANQATVNWARGYNVDPPKYGDKSPVAIPADIVEPGVQLVTAEATYSLVTPFASLMQSLTGSSAYNYDRFSIMRPRVNDTIKMN